MGITDGWENAVKRYRSERDAVAERVSRAGLGVVRMSTRDLPSESARRASPDTAEAFMALLWVARQADAAGSDALLLLPDVSPLGGQLDFLAAAKGRTRSIWGEVACRGGDRFANVSPVSSGEAHDALERVWAELGHQDRALLTGRYWMGLTGQALREHVPGCPVTVDKALSQARRELEARLARELLRDKVTL